MLYRQFRKLRGRAAGRWALVGPQDSAWAGGGWLRRQTVAAEASLGAS